MKTLEEYLNENIHRDVIDHSLRAQVDNNGKISFYVHPQGVDGDTLDFCVDGNQLFQKGSSKGSLAEIFSRLVLSMADQTSWNLVGVVEPSEVKGQKQLNAYFGLEYVDQTGPGILGDDYSGHIFLPIADKFLKIWFAS